MSDYQHGSEGESSEGRVRWTVEVRRVAREAVSHRVRVYARDAAEARERAVARVIHPRAVARYAAGWCVYDVCVPLTARERARRASGALWAADVVGRYRIDASRGWP